MSAGGLTIGYHVIRWRFMLERAEFEVIVKQYKTDPESVYNTWFVQNADRLKAFRSIRRGVEQVVREIKAGLFGNDFRRSSLELVLNSITEQEAGVRGCRSRLLLEAEA